MCVFESKKHSCGKWPRFHCAFVTCSEKGLAVTMQLVQPYSLDLQTVNQLLLSTDVNSSLVVTTFGIC